MTRKLTREEKMRRRIERRLNWVFRTVPMSAYIPGKLIEAKNRPAPATSARKSGPLNLPSGVKP